MDGAGHPQAMGGGRVARVSKLSRVTGRDHIWQTQRQFLTNISGFLDRSYLGYASCGDNHYSVEFGAS